MKKIGIIGAMDVEVEGLRASLCNVVVTKRAGMEFYAGTLGDKQVVVVKSGVGKVNAAICTQILVDAFEVDGVINTGVAGSLDAQINIGDMVSSVDAVHHDVDAAIFGYQPGEVPQMGRLAFAADERMALLAEQVCRRVNPEIRIFRGRVCSGDQFIADPLVKQQIIQKFHGKCTEMEGAAIAQTCVLNQIPFIIVRVISDKADGSDTMDYPTFEAAAARRSLGLVEALVPEL